jgi:4-hydroxybenzoate polyprenyltransferase
VLQTLYSGPLKHIVIIDVLTIAIGFVLRAVAGAVAIDVEINHWLLILTILLALFLALSKRRHELVLLADGATSHRPILEEYSPYLLDQMIAVVTASTLVSYVISTVSPETVQKYHTDYLGLTVVFPIYGIFRYLYLVHQNGRRRSGRYAAQRSSAARLRRSLGGLRRGHHLWDESDSWVNPGFRSFARRPRPCCATITRC